MTRAHRLLILLAPLAMPACEDAAETRRVATLLPSGITTENEASFEELSVRTAFPAVGRTAVLAANDGLLTSSVTAEGTVTTDPLTRPTGTMEVDLGDVLSDFDFERVIRLRDPGAGDLIANIQPSGTEGGVLGILDFTSFGFWAEETRPGRFDLAVGAFGFETPFQIMPDTGAATYTGTTLGFAADGTTTYAFAAQAAAAMDFATNAFTGDFFDFRVESADGSRPFWADGLGADFAGGIAEDAFSGTLVLQVGTQDFASGQISGRFYGLNAQEIGGSWTAAGSGVTFLGAFGMDGE